MNVLSRRLMACFSVHPILGEEGGGGGGGGGYISKISLYI